MYARSDADSGRLELLAERGTGNWPLRTSDSDLGMRLKRASLRGLVKVMMVMVVMGLWLGISSRLLLSYLRSRSQNWSRLGKIAQHKM